MSESYDDPNHRPEALQRLRKEPAVPDALEERVVRSLRSKGILRPAIAHRRWLRWPLAAAALMLCFVAGRLTSPGRALDPGPSGTRWMVLLYEDDTFQGPAPGREQEYVEEYRAWAIGLRSRNQLVDAAELLPTAARLDPPGLPPADASGECGGRLSGYFIITAPTLEDARAITASIPHLKHQGRVAIQPLGAS